MLKHFTLIGLFACGLMAVTATPAEAKKKYKNLKVLEDNGKQLQKGMKSFTKGLGVKCKACHIKGKFDSDEMEVKVKARKFFESTVGEKDQAKRDAALADLLKLMKLEKARAPAKIWKGVDMLVKKK